MLAASPERIREFTAGLSSVQLQTRPSPDEWSANEVLAHIRACADTRGGSIPMILAADRPTFRAVNPLTWIKSTDYLELDFGTSFRAFARQRAGLMALLRSLPSKDWSRWAIVTGAGKPLRRTVHFYAEWVAVHERPHMRQIQRIAVSMRRQAVLARR